MNILAVNAGSSTLKFALYPARDGRIEAASLAGVFDGLHSDACTLAWRRNGTVASEPLAPAPGDRFHRVLRALEGLVQRTSGGGALAAVVHRVVHGGEAFQKAVVVDDAVVDALSALAGLAPLHQPFNVAGIEALRRFFPGVPQVACFDTAFHTGLPDVERTLPLPWELRKSGIRRYGFHGLSYQYAMHALSQHSERWRGRVVMAHLGSGASLCAANEGESRATTMGFTALDGLMMGTRSGSIDPGILLHLLEQGWDHARMQDLLYRRSGLLGVSGLSPDMRELRRSDSDEASLAIRLFTHRIVREVGAMAAVLGGLDALVFTGGIGEHDAQLRSDVCGQLAFLGLQLDRAANDQGTGSAVMRLSAADSPVEVWLVPADEGYIAAASAATVLGLTHDVTGGRGDDGRGRSPAPFQSRADHALIDPGVRAGGGELQCPPARDAGQTDHGR